MDRPPLTRAPPNAAWAQNPTFSPGGRWKDITFNVTKLVATIALSHSQDSARRRRRGSGSGAEGASTVTGFLTKEPRKKTLVSILRSILSSVAVTLRVENAVPRAATPTAFSSIR